MVRELREAIIVGVKASQLLQKMIEQLQNVKKWGLWDSADNSNKATKEEAWIDTAQQLSYEVKQLLQTFEDELQDIYKFQRLKSVYHLEEFSFFTDSYNNRLISDWIVRKKIQGSRANVEAVLANITLIIQSLKQEVKHAELAIGYLAKEREKMILDWKA